MIRAFSSALVLGALGACSFPANVPSTAAPAAEILPDRRIDAPASMFVTPPLANLNEMALVGFVCSAHTFPVNAGPAIVSTARRVNEETFSQLIPGRSVNETRGDAVYHVTYDLEEFTPRVDFAEQFWSYRAIATVDLTMSATVFDASGQQIVRSLITGTGNHSITTGSCAGGADVLSVATSEAISRAFESYVSRIINSEQIESDINEVDVAG